MSGSCIYSKFTWTGFISLRLDVIALTRWHEKYVQQLKRYQEVYSSRSASTTTYHVVITYNLYPSVRAYRFCSRCLALCRPHTHSQYDDFVLPTRRHSQALVYQRTILNASPIMSPGGVSPLLTLKQQAPAQIQPAGASVLRTVLAILEVPK